MKDNEIHKEYTEISCSLYTSDGAKITNVAKQERSYADYALFHAVGFMTRPVVLLAKALLLLAEEQDEGARCRFFGTSYPPGESPLDSLCTACDDYIEAWDKHDAALKAAVQKRKAAVQRKGGCNDTEVSTSQEEEIRADDALCAGKEGHRQVV